MTACTIRHSPWPVRRWVLACLGLTLVQLLLIYALSSRSVPAPKGGAAVPRFSMLTTARQSQALEDLPWLDDPSLFALVSGRGFTGAAWRRRPGVEMPPPQISQPAHWLAMEDAQLGAALPLLNARRVDENHDLIRTPAPGPSVQLHPLAPLASTSSLTVEGELAGARCNPLPELVRWAHSDVLQPTQVQVVVNEQGSVLSAVLLASSGLDKADQQAMVVARTLHFEFDPSLGRKPLSWGRLVFRWATLAEPAAAAPVNGETK